MVLYMQKFPTMLNSHPSFHSVWLRVDFQNQLESHPASIQKPYRTRCHLWHRLLTRPCCEWFWRICFCTKHYIHTYINTYIRAFTARIKNKKCEGVDLGANSSQSPSYQCSTCCYDMKDNERISPQKESQRLTSFDDWYATFGWG